MRMRILGSVYLWLTDLDAGPKTYGSYGPRSGSGTPLHLHHSSKDKKSKRSHKAVEIKVSLTFFAWWWKDTEPEPDPDLWLTDPDADPGGPKTYGSYGYGSGCGSATLIESLPSPPTTFKNYCNCEKMCQNCTHIGSRTPCFSLNTVSEYVGRVSFLPQSSCGSFRRTLLS